MNTNVKPLNSCSKKKESSRLINPTQCITMLFYRQCITGTPHGRIRLLGRPQLSHFSQLYIKTSALYWLCSKSQLSTPPEQEKTNPVGSTIELPGLCQPDIEPAAPSSSCITMSDVDNFKLVVGVACKNIHSFDFMNFIACFSEWSMTCLKVWMKLKKADCPEIL